ncbi:MAG: hypothetical protein GEU82_03275 [Luteitalea sp.]|nr:hypothetical protein [Luteitalea sp.]
MSGRRRHARFVVADSEGVLRVACDVMVTATEDALIAISSEPAAVGEMLTIEMNVDGHVDRAPVRVEESRPVAAGGIVRHRIRLSRVVPTGRASAGAGTRRSQWKTDRNLRVVRPGTRLPD